MKNWQPAVKICGLRRETDLKRCFDLKFDYVGFNFFSGSKRFIEPEAAAAMWRNSAAANHTLPLPSTRPAAVVVNPSLAALEEILRVFPELSIIQFHGDETISQLGEFRQLLAGRPLWKALRVASKSDVAAAQRLEGLADLVLFDSLVAGGDESLRGGTGQRFTWQALDGYAAKIPMGVAGGIKPGVWQQLAPWQPALIDVCSGVEIAPAEKDAALLEVLARELALYGERA